MASPQLNHSVNRNHNRDLILAIDIFDLHPDFLSKLLNHQFSEFSHCLETCFDFDFRLDFKSRVACMTGSYESTISKEHVRRPSFQANNKIVDLKFQNNFTNETKSAGDGLNRFALFTLNSSQRTIYTFLWWNSMLRTPLFNHARGKRNPMKREIQSGVTTSWWIVFTGMCGNAQVLLATIAIVNRSLNTIENKCRWTSIIRSFGRSVWCSLFIAYFLNFISWFRNLWLNFPEMVCSRCESEFNSSRKLQTNEVSGPSRQYFGCRGVTVNPHKTNLWNSFAGL